MDVVIRVMKDLYDACERQQNLSKVFHSHEQEIDNIVQILKVIERESVLQVATMMEDLKKLRLRRKSRTLEAMPEASITSGR